MNRINQDQQLIISHIEKHGQISLAQAVAITGGNLYCNAPKHVGARLKRMIDRGLITRLKPGIFILPYRP